MKTNLEELTRNEIKEIAKRKEIDFPNNLPTEKLIKLIEDKNDEKASEEKMTKPSDGKLVKCIIRALDPNQPFSLCEVGVNGYFLSIPLDTEVEVSRFFFGAIRSAYWVKPILDENGQVIKTEMRPKYAIEIL